MILEKFQLMIDYNQEKKRKLIKIKGNKKKGN